MLENVLENFLLEKKILLGVVLVQGSGRHSNSFVAVVDQHEIHLPSFSHSVL